MLLVVACSHKQPTVAATPTTTTLDKVWELETSGPSVRDTSVTFALATGRTIVLRHAAPDDAIFAVLQFAPAKDSLRTRDSIHVTIRPTPGKYAFTLVTTDKIGAGAQAMFSYAIHFRTPSDAVTRYPSPGRFEAVLLPATIGADNKVTFLTGSRPAADMMRFPLTAAGTFALTALR